MAGKNSNAVLASTQETWLPIVGWEGFYEVSDFGRVRSVKRTVLRRCNGSVCDVRLRGRIRALMSVGGYRAVALWNKGSSQTLLVHRGVVEAFIKRIPPRKEVNHKDGVKSNNSLGNLEIVSPKQNSEHAIKTGLVNNTGENHPRSILTAEDVREIRKLRTTKGTTYIGLANAYGVSEGCICGVLGRQTWKHIP